MATEDWTRYAEPNSEWEAKMPPSKVLDLGGFNDVSSLRAALTAAKQNMSEEMGGSNSRVKETDHSVPMRDGNEITVRSYSPADAKGGSPLAFIIHGGGFVIGDLTSEQTLCRQLADQLDFVVLNVDYRLAPEHPFPVPVHDCWDALQWASKNASSLGADPTKGFILGGTSAGGNISIALSHLARDQNFSPPLTGLLLMIPGCLTEDVVPEKYKSLYSSRRNLANAPILTKKSMDLFSNAYKGNHASELYNPFNWPSGHGGLPPSYFQVCGLDPLRDEALLYEQVLRTESGVKTKLSVYPGLPHGFASFAPHLDSAKEYMRDSVEGVAWLQGQLKG